MKRKVQWIVLGAVLAGIVLALATNHLFDKAKGPEVDPLAEQINANLKLSKQEFDHRKAKPSAEAIKGLHEIAKLRPNGYKNAIAPTEQWLRRMHVNANDTPEFQELVGLLLEVEPETPKQYVAALRTASQSDRGYYVQLLTAFGKPSVAPVAAAFEEEAREARDDLHLASKSVYCQVIAALGDDAVPVLRDALKSKDVAVRRQALRAFAQMSPERANEARADIEIVLKDESASVRAFAALALGEMTSRDKVARSTPALLSALYDADPHVCLAAARTLSRYDTVDREQIVNVLQTLLKTNPFAGMDATDKGGSWWDVAQWSPTVADLRLWKKANSYTPLFWDETTAHVLLGMGPRSRPAPETIVDLLSNCPHDGRHLVTMLAAHGERASAAVPKLRAMLKDNAADGRQRRKALIALGTLGKSASAAVPDIQAALNHSDGPTRWQAFLALMQLNPEAAKEMLPPALHGAISAASGTLRRTDYSRVSQWTSCLWRDSAAVLVPVTTSNTTVDATGQFRTPTDLDIIAENDRIDKMLTELERNGPLGKDGMGLLLAGFEGTRDLASTSSRQPQRLLALIAREGSAAQPAVLSIVRSWPRFTKDEVPSALVKIGDVAVMPLAKELENPQISLDQQLKIIELLPKFEAKAKPAVPTLVKLIRWEDETEKSKASRSPSVYEAHAGKAAAALGALGPTAADAVPALRELLKNDNNEVRRHAADALGLMGPTGKAALPDLIELFQVDSKQLRVVAARAVGRIGKDALQPLTKALESPVEDVRLCAISALTYLPPADARSALPALEKMASGEQAPAVRDEAKHLVKALEVR